MNFTKGSANDHTATTDDGRQYIIRFVGGKRAYFVLIAMGRKVGQFRTFDAAVAEAKANDLLYRFRNQDVTIEGVGA